MNTDHNPEFDSLYGELRRIARGAMRGERPTHTLQPTALVHEFLLKLPSSAIVTPEQKAECLRWAPRVMRQILIEWARRRGAKKRQGGQRVEFDLIDIEAGTLIPTPSLEHLAEALTQLWIEHPEWAEVIELTFFFGMTQEEISQTLNRPIITVQRHKASGLHWLREYLSSQ